mmetsp:Transcript_2922/g.7135  ORF Transcript_2922/g.7135 Transcript_2922/m.7135 type:complete len:151 (+) Transcript_2922:92-544(+)
MASKDCTGRLSSQVVTPYFCFNGVTRDALALYSSVFGGTTMLKTYEHAPKDMAVPEDKKHLILHGSLTGGAFDLMACDVFKEPTVTGNCVQLCINFTDEAEETRCFHALSVNGQVLMPLQSTFWGARFGTLVDKFGVTWMLHMHVTTCPA